MSQIRRMPSKKLTLWLQGKVCKASKGGDDSVAIISLLCIRATSDPLTLPTPNNPFFIIILNHQQMAICLEIFVFVFPIFSNVFLLRSCTLKKSLHQYLRHTSSHRLNLQRAREKVKIRKCEGNGRQRKEKEKGREN